MLEDVLQKRKPIERPKCIKCKGKDATGEDQMCDNCRFLLALEDIIKNRK